MGSSQRINIERVTSLRLKIWKENNRSTKINGSHQCIVSSFAQYGTETEVRRCDSVYLLTFFPSYLTSHAQIDEWIERVPMEL